MTSIAAPNGETLNYAYAGSLPVVVATSGTVSGSVAYGYDANFFMTGEQVNGEFPSPGNFSYDADGLLTVFSFRCRVY